VTDAERFKSLVREPGTIPGPHFAQTTEDSNQYGYLKEIDMAVVYVQNTLTSRLSHGDRIVSAQWDDTLFAGVLVSAQGKIFKVTKFRGTMQYEEYPVTEDVKP